MTARLGLRTLINLRGRTQSGSDALSREAARELGLAFHDMAFESRGASRRDRNLRLHRIYTSMQTPAIIHCKSGADRAGLAAGLILLFEGGASADALRHLSWRFGHIKVQADWHPGRVLSPLSTRRRGPQAFPRLGKGRLR